MEVGVDFHAIVEYRLIPARVRSEWARLKGNGLASIWVAACQDSSPVGNAAVGVISMKGAPLALPSFATASLRGSLIAVGRCGASYLLVLVGSCTWLSCMVIRGRILMLSSLL